MKDEWKKEVENLSAGWQIALDKAATTSDPDIKKIYTDLAGTYQAKVQELRVKIREVDRT